MFIAIFFTILACLFLKAFILYGVAYLTTFRLNKEGLNYKRVIYTLYRGYNQGSKGIRQWPIYLCTSPMMIHKITPSVNYN